MNKTSVFRTIGTKEGLVDRVVHELEEMIFNGQLEPETKLLPEREVADQLGVSRTVLREAIRILTTKGLLETRHGVGTVVRKITSQQVAEPINLFLQTQNGGTVSFEHLHQVRSILETEIAALAVSQASEEDIIRLQQIVDEMKAAYNDPEVLAARDADFHRALVEMTRNPLLMILSDSIRYLLKEYIRRVTVYLDPLEDVLPPHFDLVEAVKARNPDLARLRMQEHQNQMLMNYQKWVKISGQEKRL